MTSESVSCLCCSNSWRSFRASGKYSSEFHVQDFCVRSACKYNFCTRTVWLIGAVARTVLFTSACISGSATNRSVIGSVNESVILSAEMEGSGRSSSTSSSSSSINSSSNSSSGGVQCTDNARSVAALQELERVARGSGNVRLAHTYNKVLLANSYTHVYFKNTKGNTISQSTSPTCDQWTRGNEALRDWQVHCLQTRRYPCQHSHCSNTTIPRTLIGRTT